MRKTENRATEVKICDLCREETSHLVRCCVCKREFCWAGADQKHSAYAIELFRYADHARINSHICKECTESGGGKGLQLFLDSLFR
jgi:hypothetical protein